MTALSDFELEMDAAHKAGKLTVDQLTASRDKLFEQTQAASGKEDWAAYCKAIDDMRPNSNSDALDERRSATANLPVGWLADR